METSLNQGGTQGPCSVESAGLDCAQWQTEAAGDLLLREPFLVGEAYHLGMCWPESVECLPDDRAVEYLINAAGYRRHVYVSIRHQWPARRALTDVGGDTAGNDAQVSADAGLLSVEPACRPPQPHKSLLNHLFGQALVAEVLHPEAKEPSAVPPVKRGQRGSDVPRGDLGHKVRLLGRWLVRSSAY
jgi:hypothetical protein